MNVYRKKKHGLFLSRARNFDIFAVFLLFSIVVIPSAHAYLDPGTGSFILQTLIAALFGALFVLKSYWLRIKLWLSGSKSESDATEPNSTEAREAHDNQTDQKASDANSREAE